MLEKLSKMTVRDAMIALAGRPPMHGELQRWLSGIAEKVGISFRMARSLWLGEITKQDHHAAREIKRHAAIEKARRERASAMASYQSIAEGLRARDEDFHRNDIAALEHAARILRDLDRA